MKLIKSLASGLMVIMLAGCSTHNHTVGKYLSSYIVGTGNKLSYSKEAYNKSDITYVGIPTILGIGFQGTTFPITQHYSLTAYHVTKVTFNKVIAYNEACDIAIIKHNNEGRELPVLSDIGRKTLNQNKTFTDIPESVKTYGYSRTSSLPVESSGRIVSNFFNKNEDNTLSCTMFTSESGGKPGMSGGPVYNNNDEVVGVLIAEVFKIPYYDSFTQTMTSKNVDYTVFTPVQAFAEWLEKSLDKTEDKGQLKLSMKNYIPVKMIIQK